jgi:nucleoside-diphosphate-sugar epimerase
MRAFVSGGTGFIGWQVVQKLLRRGHAVWALARSASGATRLQQAGATVVWGDILDPESMRDAMRDSDIVFHLAAWYKLGSRDIQAAEPVNVVGTRNVLELAYQLGVPKIIYTSTISVLGDTAGEVVDEDYRMPIEELSFINEYERTKWMAHYQVALPLIEKGAPIIIVMPGGVYGPGDPSLVGDLMRAYCMGLLPLFPGPETRMTLAHVEDIAEGHLLAAEKGRIGESYLLTGPPVSFHEMATLWAQASGKPAPVAYIPAASLRPLAPLVGKAQRWLPLPPMLSQDGANIMGTTYLASSAKAQQELGWQTRPLEEGFRETFTRIASSRKPLLPLNSRHKRAVALASGAALGVLLWQKKSRRK